MRAIYYRPDQRDDLDIGLSVHLQDLDPQFASGLFIKRLSNSGYEMDGKYVRLEWAKESAGGGHGIVVRESVNGNDAPTEVPLDAYLAQAASVASNLNGVDSPLIARIPSELRLTFATPKTLSENPDLERMKSMRMAVEQARLREIGAEQFQRAEQQSGRRHSSLGPPQLGGAPRRSGSLGQMSHGTPAQSRAPSVDPRASRAPTPDARGRPGPAPHAFAGAVSGNGCGAPPLPQGNQSFPRQNGPSRQNSSQQLAAGIKRTGTAPLPSAHCRSMTPNPPGAPGGPVLQQHVAQSPKAACAWGPPLQPVMVMR